MVRRPGDQSCVIANLFMRSDKLIAFGYWRSTVLIVMPIIKKNKKKNLSLAKRN